MSDNETHRPPFGINMPPGTVCIVKKVRPASKMTISYPVWLVLQSTEIQDEILGRERAYALRVAYHELRKIAGSFGEVLGPVCPQCNQPTEVVHVCRNTLCDGGRLGWLSREPDPRAQDVAGAAQDRAPSAP